MKPSENMGFMGVWPVMVTPFTDGGEVDYDGLQSLIGWYEEACVAGLFAVCLSSEMFHLSLRERVEIARFVKRHARVPVVASGHVSWGIADQIDELNRIAGTGVDGVILVANRLARESDPPQAWMDNLGRVLDGIDRTVPLGFYECPHPYKRLLSQQELAFCAGTGRFRFMKDTCCSIAMIRERLRVLQGSPMALYNANTTTLLESLQAGAAGFSGVMANFHPELYVWLTGNWQTEPERAQRLQDFLTVCSLVERQCYPVNAKAHLQASGLPITLHTRSKDHRQITAQFLSEVAQMDRLARRIVEELGIAP